MTAVGVALLNQASCHVVDLDVEGALRVVGARDAHSVHRFYQRQAAVAVVGQRRFEAKMVATA